MVPFQVMFIFQGHIILHRFDDLEATPCCFFGGKFFFPQVAAKTGCWRDLSAVSWDGLGEWKV